MRKFDRVDYGLDNLPPRHAPNVLRIVVPEKHLKLNGRLCNSQILHSPKPLSCYFTCATHTEDCVSVCKDHKLRTIISNSPKTINYHLNGQPLYRKTTSMTSKTLIYRNYFDPYATTTIYLFLQRSLQGPRHKGHSCSPLSVLARRNVYFVSLSGHILLETMFGNCLRHSHAYLYNCTVQSTPNSLGVSVASSRFLSVRLLTPG